MIFYFLGYGAYVGAWMFYAVRFFLTIQNHLLSNQLDYLVFEL